MSLDLLKKPKKLLQEKYKPHPYQKRAIKLGVAKSCGFLIDPGLGKTSITLATFKELKKKKEVRSMVVTGPKRPITLSWPKEIQKWSDFSDLKYVMLHGSNKDALILEKADIYFVTVDSLEWFFEKIRRKQIGTMPEMFVVDESTKFKNTNTKRFKLIRNFIGMFPRRYILTGTPTPRSLINLFGQIYIIDQGRSLGRYITHFKNKYFYPSGYGGYSWLPFANTEEQIAEAIKKITIRLEVKDHLKMPELIPNYIMLQLPSNVKKTYKEMEHILYTKLDSNTEVLAPSTAVSLMKCRQIANGGIYYDEIVNETKVRKFKNLHSEKTDAVVDLIEELEGSPVLVAYEFDHDLVRLKDALGKDTPHIGGGTSIKRAAELEAAWNKGELPVLLVNAVSVAHGLNLQESGYTIIWYSLTYDFEVYWQLIQRIWRQGQKHSVMVHHLVMEGTVDEAMVGVLETKDTNQRNFLARLKQYRSSYK